MEPDPDAEIMAKLKERLGSKKDEDQLYGDLLATKLRKLSKLSKIKAKHEIDNVMFKYEVADEEMTQAAQNRPRPQDVDTSPSQSTPMSPLGW